jgi:hypothetical protein
MATGITHSSNPASETEYLSAPQHTINTIPLEGTGISISGQDMGSENHTVVIQNTSAADAMTGLRVMPHGSGLASDKAEISIFETDAIADDTNYSRLYLKLMALRLLPRLYLRPEMMV